MTIRRGQRAASDGSWVTDHHRDPAIPVEGQEQAQDVIRGLTIKVAGGLVGEQQRWLAHQSASNGDAPLSSRELIGTMRPTVGKPDTIKGNHSRFATTRPFSAAIEQWQRHLSSAEGLGNKWNDWKTKPIRWLRSHAAASSRKVANGYLIEMNFAAVSRSSRPIKFINVVFPEPDAPVSTHISPGSIDRLTSLNPVSLPAAPE
jgi:hypothetical protein